MNPQEYEILLVEDDPADAELTVLALRKERLANRIEIARDGAEALDFLFCRGAHAQRSFERPPRLVLLDLQLPRVSGHEVLRAIKADVRTRSIPVVVLTSSNQERDLVECYQLGVNSYIQKPVDLLKFQEVARQFGMYWLMVNHVPPPTAFTSGNPKGSQ
jgi:two-component system response regulator